MTNRNAPPLQDVGVPIVMRIPRLGAAPQRPLPSSEPKPTMSPTEQKPAGCERRRRIGQFCIRGFAAMVALPILSLAMFLGWQMTAPSADVEDTGLAGIEPSMAQGRSEPLAIAEPVDAKKKLGPPNVEATAAPPLPHVAANAPTAKRRDRAHPLRLPSLSTEAPRADPLLGEVEEGVVEWVEDVASEELDPAR